MNFVEDSLTYIQITFPKYEKIVLIDLKEPT